MMKILITTLLIMLSSCTVTGRRAYIKPVERCGYSSQFSKCRCIIYDMYNARSQGKGWDAPLNKCDDFYGFHVQDWKQVISPWAKNNIRMYNDALQNTKRLKNRKRK